jgi:hypothetical protein
MFFAARREVVLLFMVSNEVTSLYSDVNAQAWGFTSIAGETLKSGGT